MEPLLSIRDLCVDFELGNGFVRALDRVSLDVGAGERVGLVGESGAGKSVLARAVMGLIRRPGKIASGEILFGGRDLTKVGESELNRIRSRRIALIPQDASLALNPVLRIGGQLREVIARHTTTPAGEIDKRAATTLRRVGLADPHRVLRAYPAELSGGMKQRVGIALGLSCDPELLIADDPTSAVDVTIQAQILNEFRQLTERLGVSVLFITHDLRVVSTLCSRIAVMYAGQVSEVAPSPDLLERPRHPYAAALVRCSPTVDVRANPLPVVPGATSDAVAGLSGCRFHPRCPRAVEQCIEEYPPLSDGGHSFACWNPVPVRRPEPEPEAEAVG